MTLSADRLLHPSSGQLVSNVFFRPPGWTSADAAGLPILPGLVRPDEVLDQGVINHALRFTVPTTQKAYVFPASHQAGATTDPNYPRMGERFRLKASFEISGYSPTNRIILQALKDYGMIVADNGSSWFLTGEASTRWSDDDLHNLTTVLGSNFEAVDLTPRLSSLDQASGSTSGGDSVTVHGINFSGNAGKLQVFFGATTAPSYQILSDTTLVATAPAHSAGTVDVTVSTPYGTSPVSAADQYTYTAAGPSSIMGRLVFYNNSKYDGNNAAINAADDAAIAPDKQALLPGQTATFANYTSYSRGINGIMIDVASLPNHGAGLGAGDFEFRVGNDSNPAGWSVATATPTIAARPSAGASGSDRIVITWPDNTIQKQWLQVTLKSDTSTGLAAPDVFYFGNAIGETGNSTANAVVDSSDELLIKSNRTGLGNASITNPYDIDRDTRVDTKDQLLARNNRSGLTPLQLITAPLASAAAAVNLSSAATQPGSPDSTALSGPQPPAPAVFAAIPIVPSDPLTFDRSPDGVLAGNRDDLLA